MVELIAAAGAVIAWFGAALVVLFEDSRAAALGEAISGLGMAVAFAASGYFAPAGLIGVGGVLAAAVGVLAPRPRFAGGPTTPLTVLTLLGGLFAVWFGIFVIDAPQHAAVRVAVVAPIVLLGGAAFGATRRVNIAAMVSTLVLALGAASFAPARQLLPMAGVAGAIAISALAHWRAAEPETAG